MSSSATNSCAGRLITDTSYQAGGVCHCENLCQVQNAPTLSSGKPSAGSNSRCKNGYVIPSSIQTGSQGTAPYLEYGYKWSCADQDSMFATKSCFKAYDNGTQVVGAASASC